MSNSFSYPFFGARFLNRLKLLSPWPLPSRGIDFFLLLTVVAMVFFGLLMVYSSSYIYAQERTGDGFFFIKKQFLFAVIGFAILGWSCRIPYRKWSEWGYWILIGVTGLLVLVLIPGIGTKVGGAQRWIRMGFLNFQPGELAKFALIVFAAFQLDKKQEHLNRFVAGVLSPLFMAIPSFFLLLAQPDFGSAAMIAVVIFFLMFLAGVPKKFLFGGLFLTLFLGSLLVLSSPYRKMRLLGFLNPWGDPAGKGFQIIQSFIGLHNGGLWGVGLGNGKEKLFYLPEAHNDFIFAVIGEELGFLGVASIVLMFLYFMYRGFKIGWECYQNHGDRFGLFLATGITLILGLQGLVNMAVVLGILPTKGLTLPFISYGGSALIVDLLCVGVLLSIARGPQRG